MLPLFQGIQGISACPISVQEPQDFVTCEDVARGLDGHVHMLPWNGEDRSKGHLMGEFLPVLMDATRTLERLMTQRFLAYSSSLPPAVMSDREIPHAMD